MKSMLIKVCGMRDADNIRAVESLGINWMGFICWPKSSRFVADIPMYLPKCERVGVFVNQNLDEISNYSSQLGLSRIQLHGDETGDFCKLVHDTLQLPVIKAISIKGPEDMMRISSYEGAVDYLLFDTKCKCVGGSGTQFDWNVLDSYQGNTPYLLSGGIGPDDADRVKEFMANHPLCHGIDLNSRFEISPALKDVELLREFVETIRLSK